MKQHGPALGLKRAIDVGVAGAGLVVAAPILAATGCAIWATMGRPILFRQDRVGRDERVIRILKFRTMRPDPAGTGEVRPETDVQRITRVGRFLRDASLDELPQLVNVLRGDMSLVGPRPLLPTYLPRYSDRQRRRHEVLPGLTGWAQISGRNAISWEEKFEHDVWYVEHWTPLLDLRILAKTAAQVVRRRDISAAGHATMPEFMGSDKTGGT